MRSKTHIPAETGDIAYANATIWAGFDGQVITIRPGEVFLILWTDNPSIMYKLLYDNKIVTYHDVEYYAIHKFIG